MSSPDTQAPQASPSDSPAPNPTLSDRAFAFAMAKFGPKAEWRWRDRKLKLFERLRADAGVHTVVEVGVGAAPDLKLYGQHVSRIIGVDPNEAMRPWAQAAAAAAGVSAKFQLLHGRAEALPLPNASADAVVMTHVLCSVSDLAAALAEAKRVLRPGGALVFLEHVAAPQQSWLHTLQRASNPAVGVLGHGCSCTRRTLEAIEAAGFASLQAERFSAGLRGPLAVIDPHVCGVATV